VFFLLAAVVAVVEVAVDDASFLSEALRFDLRTLDARDVLGEAMVSTTACRCTTLPEKSVSSSV